MTGTKGLIPSATSSFVSQAGSRSTCTAPRARKSGARRKSRRTGLSRSSQSRRLREVGPGRVRGWTSYLESRQWRGGRRSETATEGGWWCSGESRVRVKLNCACLWLLSRW